MKETTIIDKHGDKHRVTIGPHIMMDEHVVSNARRDHNTVELTGFAVPAPLQGRGIGSALLHTVERDMRSADVHDLRVVIEDMSCPIHGRFWTKHGYTHAGDAWTKRL